MGQMWTDIETGQEGELEYSSGRSSVKELIAGTAPSDVRFVP